MPRWQLRLAINKVAVAHEISLPAVFRTGFRSRRRSYPACFLCVSRVHAMAAVRRDDRDVCMLASPVRAQGQDIVLGQSVALGVVRLPSWDGKCSWAPRCIESINAAGGIRGRKIVLKTLDDGYEPARAEVNTRRLIDDDACPVRLRRHAHQRGVDTAGNHRQGPIFGAFTGAELLRTPFNRYVFNVRASYFDETELIVKQLVAEGSPESRCSIRMTPMVKPDWRASRGRWRLAKWQSFKSDR